MRRLTRFFDFYKSLAASYSPDAEGGLSSHAELFAIIEKLRLDPDISKADLRIELQKIGDKGPDSSVEGKESAISLAVRVFTMVSCSTDPGSEDLLESGLRAFYWNNDTSICQFIKDSFPLSDHPGLNDHDSTSSCSIKATLRARKLRKRAGILFRPTDDLRSHLKLDHKSGILYIFHHTAFLKEHLRVTRDLTRDLSVSDSLKRGALPRQLVLEILDSIQKIIFPLDDPDSRAILQSLTSRQNAGFDPDCIRFESATIRKPEEKEINYYYFGSRLVELYEEVQNPRPRGWLEKWLQRRSGARYVMLATLLGVIIAILLGLAGLAVSSYQTWIAYQQWKHPINR